MGESLEPFVILANVEIHKRRRIVPIYDLGFVFVLFDQDAPAPIAG